jgi:hypothetical protein
VRLLGRWVRVAVGLGVGLALLLPFQTAFAQPTGQPDGSVARLELRITSTPTARTVSGVLVALDTVGQAIPDLDPSALQITLDNQPASLALVPVRPTIALAAGFLLDSSASPQVRDALANAVARSIQPLDANHDTLAIVSTDSTMPWDQANFSTSANDLQQNFNRVIQTEPIDSMVSLEQVAGALKALSGQQRDWRVLLLFTNRPLASAASAAATLGTLRNLAVENNIQIGIVALSGAGGQGVAEALAEATPGGRVEYALNATNTIDIARHLGLLLAPALGARRFELPAPTDGSHILSVGAPGVATQATASFTMAGRPAQIDSLVANAGELKPGAEIRQPTWVQARPTEAVPIDSVEWNVDGRVTQLTSAPWALLLDPEQLGDGTHELTVRIISQGRAGPFLTSTVVVPPDVLRSVRTAVRSWGLIASLAVGNVVVLIVFLKITSTGRTSGRGRTEFPPALRLNHLGGRYVAPEVLHFPAKGKLRIGYHPPYMDNQVGSREFSRLDYQDVRGDEDAVKDLSRHVGCLWRDPKTNDCFVQLGWPGPGQELKPRPQSQVFHLGRPQDATAAPFRLSHHDVVRMGTGVEFVFYQVGLRDKATPESKKLAPFEAREQRPAVAVLADERRRHATRVEADEG